MASQPLILPGELVDSVIDYLGTDIHGLGICGMVCSEWLMRSRYHIFSTVQLWPQRVRAFLELARSDMCTFIHCIHRIELDDLRRSGDEISFCDAMSLSQLSTLSRVESLKVRNMDWTAISLTEQAKLRYHLAEFRQLNRLEFENVVFHDLREVVRIASSFPLLRYLSVHVEFLKYLEYVISSAIDNKLPSGLHTIELGTDYDIPVFLSSLSATTGPSNLQALELRNIKSYHWQYIRSAIIKYSATLRHLVLAFADGEFQKMPEGEFFSGTDLSHLSRLRSFNLERIQIQAKHSSSIALIDTDIPRILSQITSQSLESIKIHLEIHGEVDYNQFDWRHLQRVLRRLQWLKKFVVQIESKSQNRRESEEWVRKGLLEIHNKRGLQVDFIDLLI